MANQAPLGMPPIRDLKVGQVVSPRLEINQRAIDHMVYGKECDKISGLLPSAKLAIAELSKPADKPWVRLRIEGTDPPKHLKVAGSELGAKFHLV